MAEITINIPDTTFVSSLQPNNQFSLFPLMYTGTDTKYGTCIGYLKFALPSLPVSLVDSAKLQLTVISKSGTAASSVVVNRVTESFSVSSVTYNTKPAFEATTSSIDITTSDINQRVEMDITALVNQWLSSSYVNNGIALTNLDGTTLVGFGTSRMSSQSYFPKLTITYSDPPVGPSSAIYFSYAQLAHIAEQLITLYPSNVITVYTKGFSAATITGTPYQLYSSPDGTYGGIFILLDNGQQEAIPLNAITAIYTGEGTVYNPNITFLTPPSSFSEGCDNNIITAIHDYLANLSNVQMYLGTIVQASGMIYKNQYGILVLSDESGNTPLFIPVTNITAILPLSSDSDAQNSSLPKVIIQK